MPLFFSLFRLLCKRLIFCTFDKTDEKEEQREREQTKEKTHKKAQSKRDGIQLFVHIIRKIHIAIYFEMCDAFVCVCKNACAYLCAHIIFMYRCIHIVEFMCELLYSSVYVCWLVSICAYLRVFFLVESDGGCCCRLLARLIVISSSFDFKYPCEWVKPVYKWYTQSIFIETVNLHHVDMEIYPLIQRMRHFLRPISTNLHKIWPICWFYSYSHYLSSAFGTDIYCRGHPYILDNTLLSALRS